MKKFLIAALFVMGTAQAGELDLETHCGFMERTAEVIKKARIGGMEKGALVQIFQEKARNLWVPAALIVDLAYQLDKEEMEPFPGLVKVMCLQGQFR